MNRIRFPAEDRIPLKLGLKTASVETRRYGRDGDVVATNWSDMYLRVETIRRIRMVSASELHYKELGHESPEMFIMRWNRDHPRPGYLPTRAVWLHSFSVIMRSSPFDPQPDPQAKLGLTPREESP